MNRREFISGASAAAAWPLAARGQEGRTHPLIAFLAAAPPTRFYSGLVDGLRDLGYQENRDFEFLFKSAEGDLSKLPSIAAEIVKVNPRVLIASVTAAAVETKKVSQSIPIVVPLLIDPIKLGLAHTFARPGMNVTGILSSIEGLPGKQLEILREIAPPALRTGVLINPQNPQNNPQVKDLMTAAEHGSATIISVNVQVVNLTAARSIGIKIPETFLVRADEVIE